MSTFIREKKDYSDKPIVRLPEDRETVEQFLARGGKKVEIPAGVSKLDKTICLPQGIADDLRAKAKISASKRWRKNK